MELQVVLGRDRGRVIPVSRGVLRAGRDADCDLVLASDLVSREHAQLVVGPSDVRVTDLESKNGTFINGARVLGEAVAVPGDIVLVADFPLRIHRAAAPALADAPSTSTLAGTLSEVPPATLLRYLSVLKKTAVATLTSPPLRGEITFTGGRVAEVVVDTKKTSQPLQALTAILRWKGTFEVEPATDSPSSLLLGLDALLAPVGSAARPSKIPPRM